MLSPSADINELTWRYYYSGLLFKRSFTYGVLLPLFLNFNRNKCYKQPLK